MNLYPLLRPALFTLDPEAAHDFTLKGLKLAQRTGVIKLLADQSPAKPVKVMGLTFKNKLGLAAGLDKNGDYIDALAALNFGFLE
ncbi:MAG: quinone-dependent dihydroorotate dehydrogenase, partial [Methylococcaceae bacterium]|nr:quinone-dependent dihydroorotate dehydrogenase [Methylococcaceae bacterium]